MGYKICMLEENPELVLKQTSIDKAIISVHLPFIILSDRYKEIMTSFERKVGKVNSHGYGIKIVEGARARLSSRVTDSGDMLIHISIQTNLNRFINFRKGISGKVINYKLGKEEVNDEIKAIVNAIVCMVDDIVEALDSGFKSVGVAGIPENFEPDYQLSYFESSCDTVIQEGSDKDISNIGCSVKRCYPKKIISVGNTKKKDIVLGVRVEVNDGHSIGGYVKEPSVLRLEDRKYKKALSEFNTLYSKKTLAEKLILLKDDGASFIKDIFENSKSLYKIEAFEAREIIRSKVSENAYNQIIRILFTFNGTIKVTYKNDLIYRNVLKLRKEGILIKVCRSEYRLDSVFHQALCAHYHKIRSFKV